MVRIVVVAFALVSWVAADVATVRAQQPPTAAPAPTPKPALAPPAAGAPQPGVKPPVAGQPGAAARAPQPPPVSRKHFRWVDSAGVVNYADSPPPIEYAQPDGATPPPPATAAVDDKELERQRTGLVEELLAITLVKRTLGDFATHPPKVPDNDAGMAKMRDAVNRIMSEAVNPAATYAVFRDGVRSRVDDALLGEVLAWYRTPVGRKLARLAVEAESVQGQAELPAFAEKVRRDPPGEERIALVDRLDAGLGLTETKLDVFGVSMKMMGHMLERAGAQGARARMSEDAISVMRNRMRASARPTALLTLLYAYRSVPDAELKSYVDFLETEAGRWYARTTRTALTEMVETVLEKAAGRIATVAGNR
ncbi:MAG: hypothetical protein HYR51_13740 [Candidatus Rokubacteria bacterium]|nr:hypothetical protein [Candidatus Rokubacteria bacterium]